MAKRYKAKQGLITLIKALSDKDYEDDLIKEAEENWATDGTDAELYIAEWESKDGGEYTIALTERYFYDLGSNPIEYGKWYNLTDLTVDQIEKFINAVGFSFYHNVLWTRGVDEPEENEVKGGLRGKENIEIACIHNTGALRDKFGDTIGTAGDRPAYNYEQIWIKALE